MATSTNSRSAGSSRSVCSAQLGRTARWNRRRLARAREGRWQRGQFDDRSVPRLPRAARASQTPPLSARQIFRSVALTPYLLRLPTARRTSSFAPIARAPSSPRTANINRKTKWRRRRPPSAASTRCAGPSRSSRHRAAVTAPHRILGHHPPRDKERQLASRKCRRESTT